MKQSYFLIFSIVGSLLMTYASFGQSEFWIEGQIRPRFEFRNGYKTLLDTSAGPAAYIEQRTRLSVGYKFRKTLTLFVSFQDVRVWGSTSLTNKVAGNFSLFQGWAKVQATPHISFKFGRQVLSYDTQRLLGGLDWAAQGSAHDALLFEYNNDSLALNLQVGAAYNAVNPSLAQLPYTVTRNYKTMQFLRLHKGFKIVDFTLWALNVGQEMAGTNGKLGFELTTGGLVKFKAGNFSALLEGYYQFGRTQLNETKSNAYLAAIRLNYKTEKPMFKFTLGADLLSGTTATSRANGENTSFNPWMGTNHALYGHMDFFYVGSAHADIGLLDALFGVTYNPVPQAHLGLTYHYFYAPTDLLGLVAPVVTNQLGHEVDFVFKYKIKKYVTLLMGYAHMFGSPALGDIKESQAAYAVDRTRQTNWAWLTIDVNLELFRHKFKALVKN